MFNKRLLNEFACNKRYVLGMVIVQWIALLMNLILIMAMSAYVNQWYKQDVNIEATIRYVLILLSAIVIRGGANVLQNQWAFCASTNVKRMLRARIYKQLMELGSHYRKMIATSEAVQISTEGVEQLEIYFSKYIPQFLYSLLAPITLFCVVGTMSIKVAVVLLLCVPLIPVSIIVVQKFAKKMLQKYWGTYVELGDSFLENLQGLTTLKIYQADQRYANMMDEEAEKFRKVTMKVLIMQLNSISVMDLVAYGGAAIGIILSILEFKSGNIAFYQCLFIILVSAEFFLPLRLLGSFFHIAMNGNAAANKIFCLLDARIERHSNITQVEENEITFSNVSFEYEKDQKVLQDINFHIKDKSLTAIVGASGCGKSTIASMVMGEQKCVEGTVRVGTCEVLSITRNTIYQKITRVKHDSYLFKGTVRENLFMGNPHATDDMMEQVLEQVDMLETVRDKGGLSMELKEKASNLSGGQRQRLALARAILHDSDIYIFDEATSNIDADSENKIIEVIYELAKQKTILLISHRLANVVAADQVLVMKDGNILEQGTHHQLLNGCGYYAELYEKQKELEQYAKGGEFDE